MTYSAAEIETIGLCICIEAVSDIVNQQLLLLRDVSGYPGEAEVIFHDSPHRDLFYIRLLDFAKESGSKQLTGVSGSCLAVLKEACSTKSFDIDGSISDLLNSVQALEEWLYHKKTMTLWLPTLDVNATLEVSRLEFLNITGNHSKHNLSRLTGVSREVANMLKAHGYSVQEEQIPLALDDFREHLAENYFYYYSTWLVELLNNVRWGMQTYLTPIFEHSYMTESEGSRIVYGYACPNDIQQDIPVQWFWRLMNNIKVGPNFKKFVCARYLKEESSLEWKEN